MLPLIVALVAFNSLIASYPHRHGLLDHLIQKILVCRTRYLQVSDLKNLRRELETKALVRYFSFKVSLSPLHENRIFRLLTPLV